MLQNLRNLARQKASKVQKKESLHQDKSQIPWRTKFLIDKKTISEEESEAELSLMSLQSTTYR